MYKTTICNFIMPKVLIKAYGSLASDGVLINSTSILTKLIQLCGTNCKHYASDLFIDWTALTERLKSPEYEGETLLFGIRESGVDPFDFIVSRFENIDNPEKVLKDIYSGGVWMLDIIVENDSNIKGFKPVRMYFGEAIWQPVDNHK